MHNILRYKNRRIAMSQDRKVWERRTFQAEEKPYVEFATMAVVL